MTNIPNFDRGKNFIVIGPHIEKRDVLIYYFSFFKPMIIITIMIMIMMTDDDP